MKRLVIILLLLILITGCSQKAEQGFVDTTIQTETGDIAVRISIPDNPRYEYSAPIIIYVPGGLDNKEFQNDFPNLKDSILITFLFPGGYDRDSGANSEGTYDYRGQDSAKALKNIVLFAGNAKKDNNGKTLNELIEVNTIDNIGIIGKSFGGNLPIETVALYGDEIKEHLDYIIQWETPVSSQATHRDLGPVIINHLEEGVTPKRIDVFNPRYIEYDFPYVKVDYSDLTYDEDSHFQVFFDGNNDGEYTTKEVMGELLPDMDGNNELSLDEDFPLHYVTYEDKRYYSLPVTQNLEIEEWPEEIATLEEAEEFWYYRESVQLYEEALENIPNLKYMILANIEDHVQSDPHKSHLHHAFDGLKDSVWLQINPDPRYVLEVDPTITEELPTNKPNTAPEDWDDIDSYCMPETISGETYQMAAIHQMADRKKLEISGYNY